MWQQWLNAILGLWVIVLGFVMGLNSGYTWTVAITGLIIAILGFWSAASTQSGNTRQAYQ